MSGSVAAVAPAMRSTTQERSASSTVAERIDRFPCRSSARAPVARTSGQRGDREEVSHRTASRPSRPRARSSVRLTTMFQVPKLCLP